ncbi:MAG: RNA-binding S4 domain-containing protein [Clostridiales bacterium]|nr:RNA-binding S4 domain-containing protein [Clostridiales bacterium]
MKEIEIKDESIKLFQLLKYAGLIPSGGEAKFAISEGYVKVNGNIEKQKGKKIYKNDIIEFQGNKVIVK